jgi:hypothetical protein
MTAVALCSSSGALGFDCGSCLRVAIRQRSGVSAAAAAAVTMCISTIPLACTLQTLIISTRMLLLLLLMYKRY